MTIPYEFLAEETRTACLDQIRQDWTVAAARQKTRKQQDAERARLAAEQELARAQERLAALNNA